MTCPSGLPEGIDGVQGSAEGSLVSDETAIRFVGSGWVQCPGGATAGGCTGARSGPLAKMCGSTTHILRSK